MPFQYPNLSKTALFSFLVQRYELLSKSMFAIDFFSIYVPISIGFSIKCIVDNIIAIASNILCIASSKLFVSSGLTFVGIKTITIIFITIKIFFCLIHIYFILFRFSDAKVRTLAEPYVRKFE